MSSQHIKFYRKYKKYKGLYKLKSQLGGYITRRTPTLVQVAGAQAPPDTDGWSCERCTFQNEPTDPRCNMCSHPAPALEQAVQGVNHGHVPIREPWVCSQCTYRNEAMAPTCEICGGPGPLPPPVAPEGDQFRQMIVEWNQHPGIKYGRRSTGPLSGRSLQQHSWSLCPIFSIICHDYAQVTNYHSWLPNPVPDEQVHLWRTLMVDEAPPGPDIWDQLRICFEQHGLINILTDQSNYDSSTHLKDDYQEQIMNIIYEQCIEFGVVIDTVVNRIKGVLGIPQ